MVHGRGMVYGRGVVYGRGMGDGVWGVVHGRVVHSRGGSALL